MPSGEILGNCPTCDEFVWEDQRYEGIPLIDVRHLWCNRKYKLQQQQDEKYVHALVEIKKLKQRINELEKGKETGQTTLF